MVVLAHQPWSNHRCCGAAPLRRQFLQCRLIQAQTLASTRLHSCAHDCCPCRLIVSRADGSADSDTASTSPRAHRSSLPTKDAQPIGSAPEKLHFTPRKSQQRVSEAAVRMMAFSASTVRAASVCTAHVKVATESALGCLVVGGAVSHLNCCLRQLR